MPTPQYYEQYGILILMLNLVLNNVWVVQQFPLVLLQCVQKDKIKAMLILLNKQNYSFFYFIQSEL